ncbi:MAG: transglycosylase family protein [Microthrixaceae bacterium]|nr:transglycosylase family protein [Microthrixaceae bacterium]
MALLLVTSLVSLSTARASARLSDSGGDATPSVATARTRLAAATDARAAAEARLADARGRQAAIKAELESLSESAASITEDLADARSQVREYAVAAYIDGGRGALAAAALDPTERAEVAWHTRLVGSTTADAAEAVDRFNTLKALNDPARVAAAGRLDAVNEEVTAAFNDAVQAAAHERDAEAALAEATSAAAARAAEQASRAAAERAAAEAAVASPSRVSRPAGSPSNLTASPPPLSRATNALPSGTPGAGSPTAAESATLARIRRCESGGNYGIVSASGLYRGAYQFDRRTWSGVGGSGDPAAASQAEQDYRALLLLRQRGTRPWPNCG